MHNQWIIEQSRLQMRRFGAQVDNPSDPVSMQFASRSDMAVRKDWEERWLSVQSINQILSDSKQGVCDRGKPRMLRMHKLGPRSL